MNDDEVGIIRLEGGKANALTPELLDTIELGIDKLEQGPWRVGILTGYSKYFSAGLPINLIVDFDRPAMKAFIERFTRTMLRVYRCEKPIVAAINGHAIAGGCVLALMCDYRVMIDDALMWIGLNETQLGIGLPAVVLEPLRAQVPPESLAPIAIEGKLFPPRDALEVKLVHLVSGDPVTLAHAIAARFARGGVHAMQQVKRALRAPIVDAIVRTDAVQTEAWLDTWFSDEAQHRLRAAAARMSK